MMAANGWRVKVCLVALACVALTWLAGCTAVFDTAGTRCSGRSRRGRSKPEALAVTEETKAAADRYVAFVGTRNPKPGKPVYGFCQLPRDLWAPFQWDVSAGLFKAGMADRVAPGFFCTELDVRDSDPLEFYALCAQPYAGGLNAFASSHEGHLGGYFFAGATELDFSIVADVGSLTFLARPSGTKDYVQVAHVPFFLQTGPLLPSIGVSGIKKKGEVGFDHFTVVSNGASPDPLSAEQEIVKTIWDAIDDQVAALELIDGTTPDFDTAATLVQDSMDTLDDALTDLDALPDSAAKRKATKRLKAARRQKKKALKKVEAENVTKSFKLLQKALRKEIEATIDLEPFSV